MFTNHNISYNNPLGDSFSSNHSANSSFSDGSSATWESSTVYTPMSTPHRGRTPCSIKREGSTFSAPTPTSTPDRYGSTNGFCAMNAMTQSMMSGYHQDSMMFPGNQMVVANPVNMADINYGPYVDDTIYNSFNSHHGLPTGTPSLEQDLYSPVSEIRSSPSLIENCVVPSQTTFMDPFSGLQSPAHPVKSLQFNLNYDCQVSDFDAGFSMENSSPESMRYLVPEYAERTPECSTPSRSSSQRQAHLEAALASVSPTPTETQAQKAAARLVRKRSKRENRQCMIPRTNIPVAYHQQPKKTCSVPGCHGKFVRHEHLKRHEKTHSSKERYPCEFCGRPFGRTDNLKSHIKLHAFPNKGKRTDYFEGAREVYERMSMKPRRSTTKVKGEDDDDQRVGKSRDQDY